MSPTSGYQVVDLIERLKKDRLTQKDGALWCLAFLQTHPVFNDVLKQYGPDIARAYASPEGNNALLPIVENIFSNIQETPHLYERAIAQQEESHISDGVDERITELHAAQPITQQTIAAVKNQRARVGREEISKLVSRYSRPMFLKEEQVKAIADQISNRVISTVEDNPNLSIDQGVKTALIEELPNVSGHIQESILRDKQLQIVSEVYKQQLEVILAAPAVFSEKPEITAKTLHTIIQDSTPPTTPEELTAITINASQIAEPVAKAIVAGELFETLPEPEKKRALQEASQQLISAINKGKVTAPLADVARAVVGQNTFNDLLDKITAKDTVKTISSVAMPTGKAFPTEALRRSILTAQQTQKTHQTVSLISRMTETISRPVLGKNTQMLQIITWYTVITGKRSFDNTLLYVVNAARNPWAQTLKLGAEIAVKKGAEAAIQKVAGTTIGKTLGGFLGSALGPPGVIIGTFLGDKIIKPSLSAIFGFFGKTLSLFFGGVANEIISFSDWTPRKDTTQKNILMLTIAIMVPIVVILIFPTLGNIFAFISSPLVQEEGRAAYSGAALSLHEVGGGSEGQDGEEMGNLAQDPQLLVRAMLSKTRSYPPSRPTPTPPPTCTPSGTNSCAAPFCDPQTNTCIWPTTGTITQGPNGAFSHSCDGKPGCTWNNAIDIAGSIGTPIDVTHDGTVVYVRDHFQTNDYGTGGYGNYIIVEGKDANGKTYQTLYAHLAHGSIIVQEGQTIKKGEKIGGMDNTGFSTGSHLHYELRAGGTSLNQVLPQAVAPNGGGTTGG